MTKAFWDKEYDTSEHLALSSEASEDLRKFTRWMEREFGSGIFSRHTKVLDLGSGNGRNLIWLSETYGSRGTGYDISTVAVAEAKKAAALLPLSFEERSIVIPPSYPFTDASQDLILDMMTSHFLNQEQRMALRDEQLRLLKPGGFLFFKTFLADEDMHVQRLLKEHPGPEPGSYIHPQIGVMEHAYTEAEILAFFEPYFEIRKIHKSHKHIGKDGRAWKRRTVSVYLEKKGW